MLLQLEYMFLNLKAYCSLLWKCEIGSFSDTIIQSLNHFLRYSIDSTILIDKMNIWAAQCEMQ